MDPLLGAAVACQRLPAELLDGAPNTFGVSVLCMWERGQLTRVQLTRSQFTSG